MRIAIIPARGGSKRIPRKNIKDFHGKPMISYSIEAAKNSGCFDKIIVSTDDIEIAEIAKKWGADVPFIRPKKLSDDYTGTIPVINHAIDLLSIRSGEEIKQVCCIYATAPFLLSKYIKEGLNKLIQLNCNYAFSATSYDFPLQRAFKVCGDHIEMLNPEAFNTRSQDLEEYYHDAGQFYWGTPKSWKEGKSFFSGNSIPIILPKYLVQDIDNQDDWKRAELMYATLNK